MTTLDKTEIETARDEFVHSITKEQIERWAYKWADDLLSTAEALSSIPEQGVKALEWRKWDQRDNGGSADTIVGHYHVWTHHEANGRWFWRLSTTGLGPIAVQGECAAEDEAKAAAQADYEARILSALVAPSQPAAVGVTDEMVERAARAVYEHWKFGKNDHGLMGREKPAWVHGGNSLRQDEARNYATAALEAALRSTP